MFTVDRGVKHKVVAVELKGNKYFTDDLLQERMRVQKADCVSAERAVQSRAGGGRCACDSGAVSREWIR